MKTLVIEVREDGGVIVTVDGVRQEGIRAVKFTAGIDCVPQVDLQLIKPKVTRFPKAEEGAATPQEVADARG